MSMHLRASNRNASYIKIPWSSVKCNSTGILDHSIPLSELGCASSEGDMSIPSSFANGPTSISETTNSSPNTGHSSNNNGKHDCKPIQTPQLASALPIATLMVHDESKTNNDGDQAGDILPVDKAVDNTAVTRIRQELRLLRATAAKYKCATQAHGCAEVRVGWDGEIPRWRRGSELSYIVCVESFPAPLSSMVEDSMKAAIGMWDGIGVSFKQVARNNPATFAVTYENRDRNVYACSFFPNESSRELTIYPPSLREPNYLANILAHEVGHILGLRHEFAHKREKGRPSALLGSENADSIMNYFDHPKQLQVREQDREELKHFYAYDEVKYGELSIFDVNPEVWFFGKNIVMNDDTDLLPELR